MKPRDPSPEIAPLAPLVGEWSIEALAPWAPRDLREMSHDGSSWDVDFDLVYTRTR
jgi:hypothetical protein